VIGFTLAKVAREGLFEKGGNHTDTYENGTSSRE
jgi:hypothetical protein